MLNNRNNNCYLNFYKSIFDKKNKLKYKSNEISILHTLRKWKVLNTK